MTAAPGGKSRRASCDVIVEHGNRSGNPNCNQNKCTTRHRKYYHKFHKPSVAKFTFDLFSDNITPVKHVWFVGDELLERTANTLRKLMNQHIFDATKPELYIYREYHVEAFHDSEVKPTYRNIMRKVRNNLTFAMNKFPAILPTYLVILINNGYLHDPAFVEFEMKTILKRVFNDVGRLLSSRKDQLAKKNCNISGDTEVFMIRPIPKPAASLTHDYKFKNTRRNFNQMLDKLALTYNFKPLNIDEINCSQRALFEKQSGELSDYGRERMWHSISEFLKRCDALKSAALSKAYIKSQDIATQCPEAGNQQDHTSEKSDQDNIDAYYTTSRYPQQREVAAYNPRRRSEQQQFDDYHRRYDREAYNESYYEDY